MTIFYPVFSWIGCSGPSARFKPLLPSPAGMTPFVQKDSEEGQQTAGNNKDRSLQSEPIPRGPHKP